MKLTKREKVMLIVLGVAAIVGAGYYFLLQPQLDTMRSLTEELLTVEQEVAAVKIEMASEDKLDGQIETMNTQIEQKSSKYFPSIIQEELVVMLDELFTDTKVEVQSTSFTQIAQSAPAAQGDAQTASALTMEKMSVSFPFTGSYEQLMDMMKKLEGMGRTIVIQSLQMSNSEEGLTGAVNLDFYAINKLEEQLGDKGYLDWPYKNNYGTDNPFGS